MLDRKAMSDYSDNRKKHMPALCGQSEQFLLSDQVVHIVTTMILRVKYISGPEILLATCFLLHAVAFS
jgi:hypothetical protein